MEYAEYAVKVAKRVAAEIKNDRNLKPEWFEIFFTKAIDLVKDLYWPEQASRLPGKHARIAG